MKTRLMSGGAVSLLALTLVCGSGAGDSGDSQRGHDDGHVIVKLAGLKWDPAPPELAPGAAVATLVGDPGKAGSAYTIYVKLPDGYQEPPHWHPVDENVTVIRGMILIGRGEKLEMHKTEELPAGSFMHMPRGMRHFGIARGETIVQLHGVGPLEIHYVDAADDPRRKK